MKISFQLKMGDLNKAGFAPIQLTVSWDGQRVRESTGERTRPEWFEAGRVRAVKGSYFADINARLTDLQTALERAQQDADNERRLLSEVQVREAIDRVRNPDAYAAPAAGSAPAAPTNALAGLPVLELVKQWMAEEAVTVSKKTGRVKAKTTMSNINGTYEKLREFEQARGEPLDLMQMDLLRFYNPFRIWFMEDIGQGINTFGKHISRIRSFCDWCVDQDLPVNPKYRKFVAPSRYVGVDALTEEELQALWLLDFQSADIRRKLYYGYSAKQGSELDSPEFLAYVATVELARDKFLSCAYSAMHISDADAALRSNIKRIPGIKDRVLEVNRGKNLNPCYVPFFDDSVFHLVELTAKYAGKTEHLVPRCSTVNEHLKTIARLIGLTRLELTTKIGRKSFVTIKVMRGAPTRLVMMATGHTTEASFNHYLGVDLVRLLEQYRKHQILPAEASSEAA